MLSKNIPLLSRDEEFKLIYDWQLNGNKKSLQKIIRAYRRMPEAYAKKYFRYGVPKEDLIQEGIIGIIQALDKFDLKKEF